jgi:hypothetical protein
VTTPETWKLNAVIVTLLAGLAIACSGRRSGDAGICVAEPNPETLCSTAVDGGTQELGLSAYRCQGKARPDERAHYVEGIPRGMVCADRAGADGEERTYCCTDETTSCAYDPVAPCEAPSYGYQCRGANRPESFNAALFCGQGVRQGDLINYCCSGTAEQDGCIQSDSVVCSPRMLGFTCLGKNLPKAEQLGANKSRADYYYLLCSTPTPAGNVAYNNYCCYTPALVPMGGSCVQHTSVPGCEPGRFGFACYGPETPEEDFLPMHCPAPGVSGRSAQGYPAKLYCCDFQ